MLSFSFNNIHCDNGVANDILRAQIWIQADFEVRVPEGLLLSEPYWCVVELAIALAHWLTYASQSGPTFRYESIDDSEPNLLWFRRVAVGGWLVGSAWQRMENRTPCTFAELTAAARLYIERVREAAQPYLTAGLHIL